MHLRIRAITITSAAAALAPPTFGQLAYFHPLPMSSGPAPSNHAADVSGDGQVIAGGFTIDAVTNDVCRWVRMPDETWALHVAGAPSVGFDAYATATGAALDGSVLCGWATWFDPALGNQLEAFRWTSLGFEMLGTLTPPPREFSHCAANAIASDGTTVVGTSQWFGTLFPPESYAVTWSAAGAGSIQPLPGHAFAQAFCTSTDGQIIGGNGGFEFKNGSHTFYHALLWQSGSMSIVAQSTIPFSQDCGVFGISDNGDYKVGGCNDKAFVIRPNAGFTDITPPGFYARANDVSADGTRIVGVWADLNSPSGNAAFVWDDLVGMRELKHVLTNDHGLNLTGWSLVEATAISNDGTIIAGNGINPAGQPQAWVVHVPGFDADGDGLLDDWEINGVPFTGSTGARRRYVLDFDGDGNPDCDPLHKDLLVEVDAMPGLGPSANSVAMVRAAFANAPVSNPSGVQGINLHVVVDELNIPTAIWTRDDTNGNGTKDWPTEFDAVKLTASSGTSLNGYFGTTAERNDPEAAGIREARKKVFRYCIFAVALDMADATSGIAELPGNDLIVTLGLWSAGGDDNQRAGTFMHELGHALGLGHGGGDHINFKPNYYSVMSYNWQTPRPWHAPNSWPLSPGRPGYSAFAMQPPLLESSLTECLPLAAPGSSLAGVKFVHNTHNDPAAPPVVAEGRFDVALDWNGDGMCSPVAVSVDVTRVRDTLVPSPGQILNGHDDWAALIFNFRGLPSFADGVHNPGSGENLDELTEQEDQAISQLLAPFCAGEIVADRLVDVADLLAVINQWGPCPAGCMADIAPVGGPDGVVDVQDLLEVIQRWGPCPDRAGP